MKIVHNMMIVLSVLLLSAATSFAGTGKIYTAGEVEVAMLNYINEASKGTDIIDFKYQGATRHLKFKYFEKAEKSFKIENEIYTHQVGFLDADNKDLFVIEFTAKEIDGKLTLLTLGEQVFSVTEEGLSITPSQVIFTPYAVWSAPKMTTQQKEEAAAREEASAKSGIPMEQTAPVSEKKGW